MHFGFLYDRTRHLFSIGYRLADADGPGVLDGSFYDLLASEARLASFIAIARGDVPQRHWFHLGPLRRERRGRADAAVVERHDVRVPDAVAADAVVPGHAARHHQPRAPSRAPDAVRHGSGACRGASPSRPSTSATGTTRTSTRRSASPASGCKRGLADDLVVAPYATALALMIEPQAALAEPRTADGSRAPRAGSATTMPIDYTPRKDRRPTSQAAARRPTASSCGTFMAHHQGMVALALANALLDNVMVERFHADSHVQATELLLQERVPRQAAAAPPRPVEETRAPWTPPASRSRRFRTPHTVHPHAQFLSNGPYVTVVTNAGGGSSRWRDLSITRWREDRTADAGRQFLYLRDVRSGLRLVADLHRPCREPEDYLVTFAVRQGRLPPDGRWDRDAARSRGLGGGRRRGASAVADQPQRPPARDRGHQLCRDRARPRRKTTSRIRRSASCSCETEYLPESSALICGRRPRAASDEPGAWAFHVLSVEGRHAVADRMGDRAVARFLGRGRIAGPADCARRPVADRARPAPSSIRSSACASAFASSPAAFARIAFATGAASDRETAMTLAQRVSRSRRRGARVGDGVHAQPDAAPAPRASRASSPVSTTAWPLACSTSTSRCEPAPATLAANTLGQSALWAHGISGDLPILLVKVRRGRRPARWCGRSCRPRSTGGSRGCAPTWSS